MAIQTASSTSVRKTITNLSEPQQIRELNRQLDWVWRQLLGKLDAKSFSTDGLKQLVESTQEALTEEISSEDIGAAAFLEALWQFVYGKISDTTFKKSALLRMLESLFAIEVNEGSITITNLVATEANINSAIAGLRQDINDIQDAVDNISVTNSMISQEVWDTIQQMIDDSIVPNGGNV